MSKTYSILHFLQKMLQFTRFFSIKIKKLGILLVQIIWQFPCLFFILDLGYDYYDNNHLKPLTWVLFNILGQN